MREDLMLKDVRPEVARLAVMMERRLRLYDAAKGSMYREASPWGLFEDAGRKMRGAERALNGNDREGLLVKVVDACNYLWMALDVAGALPVLEVRAPPPLQGGEPDPADLSADIDEERWGP